ncbi:MAG: hypothetical protein Q8K58_10805 [Acidimicrobiales bacterium]|nr:hypothetical protein [Acidimicrobiales bacterium]
MSDSAYEPAQPATGGDQATIQADLSELAAAIRAAGAHLESFIAQYRDLRSASGEGTA